MLILLGLCCAINGTVMAQSEASVEDSTLFLHLSFDHSRKSHVFTDHEEVGEMVGGKRKKGLEGRSLQLDGENDYVLLHGPLIEKLSEIKSGTLSFWFRIDSIPMGKSIAPILYFSTQVLEETDTLHPKLPGILFEVAHGSLHKRSRALYYSVMADSSVVPTHCVDSGRKNGHAISTKTWHQYVLVADSLEERFYFDGVPVENPHENHTMHSRIHSSSFLHGAGTFHSLLIGKALWFADEVYFKGMVDEVKVYTRKLTADEVHQEYQQLLDGISQ